MRPILVTCLAAACLLTPAQAGSTVETAGKAVAIALPVIATGITAYKHDWRGSAQLFVTTTLTIGTAYGLKQFVRECRPFAKPCAPGGGNWNSFPSNTTALAAAPAGFLWQRYGWQYGAPAMLATGFVGWSRVDAKQHHWWDTVASLGIAIAYNEILTTRYRGDRGFFSNLEGESQGVYASVGYRW